MEENRDDILQQLCRCYEELGEDLFLLTALLAYGENPDTGETAEACFSRLRDYIEERGREILHLSSALVPRSA